jgi:hypothetical protein
MTTTVTKTLAAITVQTDGTVIVQETVTIADGSTKTTMASTYAYAPGDSTAADAYDRVKAVCAAVWTTAVVAAYQAAHPATPSSNTTATTATTSTTSTSTASTGVTS